MTHPNTTELVRLAGECERAEGIVETHSLNGRILRALGWTSDDRDVYDPAGDRRSGIPAYTSSLDAALTLVPEVNPEIEYGERVKIDVWDSNGVYPAHVRASAWVIGARRCYAATPALALCAAALRSRAASGEK